MTVMHFVMFEPKQGIEQALVDDACKRMSALRTKCIHPTTQKPYIKSMSGGKNISSEPVKALFSYGFMVEFENEEDRKFYLQKDPAHSDFVKSVKNVVSGIGVFDYEPGVF